MGVWLQSKSGVYGLRDGKALSDPMLGVGPDAPTYFRKREAKDHLNDKDVAVIDRAAPPATYKAPTVAELNAKRTEDRQKRAASLLAKKTEAAAAIKAKQAERAKVVKKAREERTQRQAKLDADAERGDREVI